MSDLDDPAGFRVHAANVGIKDDSLDFTIIASDTAATAAAVFTRSRFAGPSVEISRGVAATHEARAIVVVSKNANVATGPEGRADAEALQRRTAELVGARPDQVLVASTGVIGRRYPDGVLDSHFDSLAWPSSAHEDVATAAEAIMTTDTHPKVARRRVGQATVVGIAKGVGMIEPDMATLLTFLLTDAAVPAVDLDAMFRRVVDRTFNSLSIDTDTSTSDTAVVLANGAVGPVDLGDLEAAMGEVALDLVLMIAADGEGATKVLEVTVRGARDDVQAKRVAKSIVNSPLVKTAVHGADPNWGRVAMAVGKCDDVDDVDQERVEIRVGDVEMYPTLADDVQLGMAAAHMAGDHVCLAVDLRIAEGVATVYGCDLTDGYVRINADYTT